MRPGPSSGVRAAVRSLSPPWMWLPVALQVQWKEAANPCVCVSSRAAGGFGPPPPGRLPTVQDALNADIVPAASCWTLDAWLPIAEQTWHLTSWGAASPVCLTGGGEQKQQGHC